jgi:F-type H+-transporting ATPase subunit alpha
MRAVARNLRVLMARFEALEALTRVGLDIDPATQQTLHRGRIMREILQQPRGTNRSIAAQVMTLTAIAAGWLDTLEPRRAREAVEHALGRARGECATMIETLNTGTLPPGEWQAAWHDCLTRSMGTGTP